MSTKKINWITKKLEGYLCYCVFNMRLKIIINLVDTQVEAPLGAGVAS